VIKSIAIITGVGFSILLGVRLEARDNGDPVVGGILGIVAGVFVGCTLTLVLPHG
jgi:hypothetical protein